MERGRGGRRDFKQLILLHDEIFLPKPIIFIIWDD
jgi:hypothetical protein